MFPIIKIINLIKIITIIQIILSLPLTQIINNLKHMPKLSSAKNQKLKKLLKLIPSYAHLNKKTVKILFQKKPKNKKPNQNNLKLSLLKIQKILPPIPHPQPTFYPMIKIISPLKITNKFQMLSSKRSTLNQKIKVKKKKNIYLHK
jgi:hypothetical protein